MGVSPLCIGHMTSGRMVILFYLLFFFAVNLCMFFLSFDWLIVMMAFLSQAKILYNKGRRNNVFLFPRHRDFMLESSSQ